MPSRFPPLKVSVAKCGLGRKAMTRTGFMVPGAARMKTEFALQSGDRRGGFSQSLGFQRKFADLPAQTGVLGGQASPAE